MAFSERSVGYASFAVVGVACCMFAVCSQETKRTVEPGTMEAPDQQLIVSVDVVKLTKQLVDSAELLQRNVTGFGVRYDFQILNPPARLSVLIAVHSQVSIAQEALRRQSMMISVGPTPVDRRIGDEMRAWKSEDPRGGSLLFRRLNTVIYLSGDLPWDERLDLAARMDEALRSRSEEVSYSDTVVAPVIGGLGLPPTLQAGQTVGGEIQVEHIAPSDALLGTENTNVLLTPGERPSLTYFAPGKAGQDSIVLVISTPGNLLSRKVFKIDLK